MNLSVLMSIYSATKASDLDRCLNSLSRQTLPATEVVIVRDGPIPRTAEQCIQSYESHLPFRHLYFSNNRGLGPALHDGLEACSYELIARVDSDDSSIPERFRKQAEFLNRESDVSLVGGWMKECYPVGKVTVSVTRRCPIGHDSIRRAAKRRNPINHPTVMFRKTHVLACNSYESCPMFEDYYLWAKMLEHGYLLSNLPEVLVETEIDSDYFRRRGGVPYVKNELHLIRKLMHINFLSPMEAGIFFLPRLPMRLTPASIRQYLYRTFLRNT
jgi:glycosyltransferase involved in cell wall biosynthesis